MNISKIRKAVTDRVTAGTKVTKKFLQSLDSDLYDRCEKIARTNWPKAKYNPWWIVLHQEIFGSSKVCLTCGSTNLSWHGWDIGPTSYCCAKCAGAAESVKQKRAATCVDKYGVDAVQKSNKVRRKFIKTMKDRYGGYTAQNKSLVRKMRKTCRSKFGCSTPFESEIVKERSRQTCIERYGVEHPMQDPTIFERQQTSGFTSHKLRINKHTFMCRGTAEPYVIKYLIKSLGCEPKNIKTTVAEGKPSFSYIRKGRHHVYHPDIYAKVKGKWWILEVKSVSTCGLTHNKEAFYRLRRKAKAAKQAGFRFRVVLVHYGRLYPVGTPLAIDDVESMTRGELAHLVKSHRQALGL